MCHSLQVGLVWDVGHLHPLLDLVPDVAHVEDRCQDLQNLPDILVRHLQNLHGGSNLGELLGVISALTGGDSPTSEVLVVRGFLEVELLLVVLGEASQQAVEDVVVPLVLNILLIICFTGENKVNSKASSFQI